jgi:hypothetical protein
MVIPGSLEVLMRPTLASILLVLTANAATADVLVNCDRGQSLNHTLEVLPRTAPPTVVVSGTCTEFVSVSRFDGLTLVGRNGAVLRQPASVPSTLTGVLSVAASRSVTIDGLTIASTAADGSVPGVWIHDGTTHVRLRNTSVVGLGPGIYVSDLSEASMVGLTVRTQGWAAIGVWHSKISVEDSLLENPTDGYQNGINVGQNAVLLMHGTTIRHMWEGISALDGGMVNVQDVNDEVPFGGPSDVVIDDPPSIQLWGLSVRNGGKVVLGAKLRILNPGSFWGGETGGVQLDGSSSLAGGQNLEIRDSLGQGVFVRNNSHASLAGAQISGTVHNAIAAVNHSTVDLGDANANPSTPTTIAGSGANDLYCDATSLIVGGANAPGATRIDCGTLLALPYPPLP